MYNFVQELEEAIVNVSNSSLFEVANEEMFLSPSNMFEITSSEKQMHFAICRNINAARIDLKDKKLLPWQVEKKEHKKNG